MFARVRVLENDVDDPGNLISYAIESNLDGDVREDFRLEDNRKVRFRIHYDGVRVREALKLRLTVRRYSIKDIRNDLPIALALSEPATVGLR